MSNELTRSAASEAVEAIGWRLLAGSFWSAVAVSDLEQAARVAAAAVGAAGANANEHLRIDLRPDRAELRLQPRSARFVTRRDVELAHGITDGVRDLGLDTAGTVPGARPVQNLELAIDAMDIGAILPFWRAVLGYADEPDADNAVLDPAGEGPSVWFQQLDEPRRQRNRIHFDLIVAHDEAGDRVAAALAAGGRLLTDEYARAFWVLADAEGNEVCVCTWQDRD